MKRAAIWPPRCSVPGCPNPGLVIHAHARRCERHLIGRKK